MRTVSSFMDTHFRHFNARETVDAAKAWRRHLDGGGEMLLAMAGAMSTGELGISLAEMIRQDKVHIISCTAANLEEDIFNLFAHDEYEMVPHYRSLTQRDEARLRDKGLNRVTDTCIPESVMRHTYRLLVELWKDAANKGKPRFPYEFIYELLDIPGLAKKYQIPPERSWVLAAKEKGIPILSPGWEDSTLGNMFTAHVMMGVIKSHRAVRSGTEQLAYLADWYLKRCRKGVPVGFFQIGGGIPGDFAICAVPMIIQDMRKKIPYWAYFAQITDSTTSYGSYSGAAPSEKITWYKLDEKTPKFSINSDASIVAPLIFAYVLGQ
ncbi:MAG: deoxyhypusine synthase family protein [Candidatus Eisenbacteria bacterium]|nr:deoxyhypusine synthase family protein [Candidatus Eisenbacteria bacterium]